MLDSKFRGARVLSTTAFWEKHLGRIDLHSVDAQWLLSADGFAQGRLTNLVKRGLDIAASLSLLVLALPVMLLVALMIKLESPGPILYRQQRVGLHDSPFTLFKPSFLQSNTAKPLERLDSPPDCRPRRSHVILNI